MHVGIIPTKVVGAVARFLSPLFRPPVLAAAIGGLVVVDGLLLRSLDRGLSIDELLLQPSHLLTVIGLIMVGGAFHEFGHATATRYGGAQPGVIGAGIYLLWPVFYNDLNDSYRLSRAGRLRADLGGVYFNTLFILALAAAYGLTGFEPLVAAIVFQHLSVLQQFLPFLRLDGYYIVSDVAGVPDLFGYVRPVLRRLVPWHTKPTVVDQLKRGARIIVTIWVLLTVPLVAGCLVFAVATVPDVASATWRSISIQASVLSSTTEPVDAVLSGLQLLVLAVPCVGLIVPMVRMLRRSRLGAGRRGVI